MTRISTYDMHMKHFNVVCYRELKDFSLSLQPREFYEYLENILKIDSC